MISRTITFVHDVDDWALHNVEKALLAALPDSEASTIRLTSLDAFVAAPWTSDVIVLGYLGIASAEIDFSAYCSELLVTVHDPCEISHFTDRPDWSRYPLKHLDLTRFTRLAVTTGEMEDLFRTRYHREVLHVKTYPHTAPLIARLTHEVQRHETVRFCSSTSGTDRHRLSEVLRRIWAVRQYLRDESGRFSLRQLSSMLIYKKRKNVALLERLRSKLLAQGAEVSFSTGSMSRRTEEEYLTDMARSHVYVCASHMEGGPLPVMEAVLCGLAVISTDVGQVRDWVVHGENGFICRNEAEFTAACERYIREPALLQAHMQASQARARRSGLSLDGWRAFLWPAARATAERAAAI